MNRPHIFNASLVLLLPTLREQVGLRQERARRLGDRVDRRRRPRASRSRSTPTASAGPQPHSGTGYSGNQRPNARGRRVVPGERRAQGADPQPRRLHARRLPARDDRATAGRGICEGPRFFQMDLSLYKNISLSKRVKAQLRFEMFNIFNNVNFLQGSVNSTFTPLDRHLRHRRPADGDQDHRLHARRSASARRRPRATRGRRSSASSCMF